MNRPQVPRADVENLERELRALEREAASAVSGFEAQFYNKAGDRCLEAGLLDRALRYYGQAIDSYLAASRWDSAAAVCRKLLRVAPSAVRAHCTLAWLAIGRGWVGDARRSLADYVAAARRAGMERVAIEHLRMMARTTAEPDVLAALADHLTELGDEAGAAEIVDAIALGQPVGAGDDAHDPEVRWSKVLRAALMGPDEVGSR